MAKSFSSPKNHLQQKLIFLIEYQCLNEKILNLLSKEEYDSITASMESRESLLAILIKLSVLEQRNFLLKSDDPELNSLKLKIENLLNIINIQESLLMDAFIKAKNQITKELQNLNKSKKNISAYKTKVDHHQIDESV